MGIRLSRIDSFNKSQRILSSASSSSSSSSMATNKEKHAITTTKKHHTATSGVKREYRKSRSAPTFPSVKNSTSTKPRPEEFKKKDLCFCSHISSSYQTMNSIHNLFVSHS